MPSGRAINPITNTNWEGTGVVPHIEVPADHALQVAQMMVLESLSGKAKDDEMKHFYQWHLKAQKILYQPVVVEQAILKSYSGTYGERHVTLENEKLYYQRGARAKYELIPLSQNEFMLEGLSYFRIRFITENNKVVALDGLYDNGRKDKSTKTKQRPM